MSNNPFSAPSHSSFQQPPASASTGRVPGGIIAVTIICLLIALANSVLGCLGVARAALDVGPMNATWLISQLVVIIAAIAIVIGSIFTFARHDWGRRLLATSLFVAALAGGVQTGTLIMQGTGDIEVEMNNNPEIAKMPADQKEIAVTAAYTVIYLTIGFFVFVALFHLFAWRYIGAQRHRPQFM